MSIKTTQLHGGTLGDVKLLEGPGITAGGKALPDKVVWKTQKQWERNDDPGSWRREYDLYTSGFGALFTDSLRWPELYHAEDHGGRIELWMEYIDGATGEDLTGAMYEQAARELGRFQGRLYAEKPAVLQGLTNLSTADLQIKTFAHYRSWRKLRTYLESEENGIPEPVCQLILGLYEGGDALCRRIETLPVVFCHRDFWVTNIFRTGDGIRLIDWDTAGWGYLGEDIASLVADEADVDHMTEYCRTCAAAYYEGFSEYADLSHIEDNLIYELILVMFELRLAEWHMNADSPEEKAYHVKTLQKIYEMKNPV
jgi:thiamine kinase-like enzyme